LWDAHSRAAPFRASQARSSAPRRERCSRPWHDSSLRCQSPPGFAVPWTLRSGRSCLRRSLEVSRHSSDVRTVASRYRLPAGVSLNVQRIGLPRLCTYPPCCIRPWQVPCRLPIVAGRTRRSESRTRKLGGDAGCCERGIECFALCIWCALSLSTVNVLSVPLAR
jgi:hypothetical protein